MTAGTTPRAERAARADVPPSSAPGAVAAPVWYGVLSVATAVPVALAWGSYFFADDYLFFQQSRDQAFGWSYLGLDLFGHFSPVTRFANKVLLWAAPGSWAAAWVAMIVVFVVLAVGLQWLARVLFGRSVVGLFTAVVLIQSLGLVRILQWWTATMNLLPGILGLVVAVAAYLRLRTGGRGWWAVVCVLGYALGLLSYELVMIMPWYLALAELFLIPRRRAAAGLDAPRRGWTPGTVALWLVLGAMGLAAALNYKLNYFQQTPRPEVGDAVRALRQGLVDTLGPSTLGLHRPGSQPTWIVVVAAVVWIALAAWTLRTRAAWKGWAFALLGVLPPIGAVIVSRVGLYGVGVTRELYYVAIPMVFLVVGAAEAVAVRLEHAPVPAEVGRRRAVVAGAAYGLFVIAFVVSGIQIRDAEGYAAVSRRFTDNVVAGIRAAERADGAVSILDADAPAKVMPAPMAPWNRASRIIPTFEPDVRFDVAGGTLRVIGPDGTVTPARAEVLWSTVPGTTPTASIDAPQVPGSSPAYCFRTGSRTQLSWSLPSPVSGPGLVVAFRGSTPEATSYRWVVGLGGSATVASYDVHTWLPGQPGGYETIASTSMDSVGLSDVRPGITLCLDSVQVLRVTSGP